MNTLKRLLLKICAQRKIQQAAHVAKITATGIYTIVNQVANPPTTQYHSHDSRDWKE